MFKILSNLADAMYYVLQSMGSKYPSQADIEHRHMYITAAITMLFLMNLVNLIIFISKETISNFVLIIIVPLFLIIYYKIYDGKWDKIKGKFVKSNRQYVVIASIVLILLFIFMFVGIFIVHPILQNSRNNIGA